MFVNDDKTEFTHFYIANKHQKNDKGELLLYNESWRNSKLLGSKLCSVKDIQHRICLGWAAFTKFSKVWLQGPRISMARKLQLYDAQVTSVMVYNCSSWAVPQAIMNKLDAAHRKHLKCILNIHWPKKISKEELYKRCNTSPLSTRVDKSRWTMLGHILRSGENTPAYLSLLFAVNCWFYKLFKGRVGRPYITLFDIIFNDLKKRNIVLNTPDDLNFIKERFAFNRKLWKKLFVGTYNEATDTVA